MDTDPDQLLTPAEAARLLGLSADMVRVLANQGRLATLRTVTGRRLFRRGEVERLATARAAAGRRGPRPPAGQTDAP